jgi:hypothetical protein
MHIIKTNGEMTKNRMHVTQTSIIFNEFQIIYFKQY